MARKFGQQYANQLRQRRPRPEDKWHLNEVEVRIDRRKQYIWRAVDQKEIVLDILVQSKRNKKVAKKFFRKLLKGLRYVPRMIVTDQLRSYGAAKKEILLGVERRQSKYLNNRAENSHQPTRERERKLRSVKSPGQAQRFLSAHGPVRSHFCVGRHRCKAEQYRAESNVVSSLE